MSFKKLSFLFTVILFAQCLTAQVAQLSKGFYKLGGGLMVSSTSMSTFTGTQVSITPSLSYYFWDNVAIGGQVSYSYNYNKNDFGYTTTETSVNSYGIGLNGRYYLPMNNFNPFIGTSFSLSKNSISSEAYYSGTVEAGVLFFISKSCGIEPSISYGITKGEPENAKSFLFGIRFNYFLVD